MPVEPLTAEQVAEYNVYNAEANRIPYDEIADAEEVPDWWGDHPEPGHSWVCRDYVLLKARWLREHGVRGRDLRVIFCWTEPFGNPQTREYHAVLGMTVGPDIWVFDSRADDIYILQKPPPNLYVWDRIQIAGTDRFEPVGPA